MGEEGCIVREAREAAQVQCIHLPPWQLELLKAGQSRHTPQPQPGRPIVRISWLGTSIAKMLQETARSADYLQTTSAVSRRIINCARTRLSECCRSSTRLFATPPPSGLIAVQHDLHASPCTQADNVPGCHVVTAYQACVPSSSKKQLQLRHSWIHQKVEHMGPFQPCRPTDVACGYCLQTCTRASFMTRLGISPQALAELPQQIFQAQAVSGRTDTQVSLYRP